MITAKQPIVRLDQSKNPSFSSTEGYRLLSKRLKQCYDQVEGYQGDYSAESLSATQLLIISNPLDKFTAKEFQNIKIYLESGGSLLYLGNEGGEHKSSSNFNYVLEEFGMAIMDDAVCRSSFMKYHHPKQAFIGDGVVNREINRAAGKLPVTGNHQQEMSLPEVQLKTITKTATVNNISLSFVYPFGCTLTVEKPSVPILSSGSHSIPQKRPIAAVASPEKTGVKGKLAVIGSSKMFHDEYFDREENAKVFDVIVKWLSTAEVQLNAMDAQDPEISEYYYVPNIPSLSSGPRGAFLESDEIPVDFNELFDKTMLKMDISSIPNVIKLYDQLGIKREPLAIVEPRFETPIPALDMAFFPPLLAESDPPALELFDLDNEFASEGTRLAQLANKCEDKDAEVFIKECGKIMAISSDGKSEQELSAKAILAQVLKHIIQWKMVNPDLI